MDKRLSILIVEDEPADAILLIETLRRGGYDSAYERVDTAEAMKRALEEGAWDVVIADYALPQFNGLSVLKLLRERDAETPFVLFSGAIGEDAAVDAIKAGASDYVMKDRPGRLISAIDKALAEVERNRKQAQAEEAGLAAR